MATKKDLPHNTEAEKAVLGAMLRSQQYLSDCVAKLTEEDFFEENENHRAIFKAMFRLNEKGIPVDTQTVTNELINSKEIDLVGGPDYLLELSDSIITFANIDHYIKIVQDQSVLRNFLLVIDKISKSYYSDDIEDISEFLSNSEKQITSVTEKRRIGDFQKAKEITAQLEKEFENLKATNTDDSVTGVPTGFSRLNMLTHGFQPTELIVLAARPGVGKTALSLNLAMNAARDGKCSVAYFSLEMPASMLFKRLISGDSEVPFDSLLTGYNVNQNVKLKLKQSCERLSNCKIYVDDTSGIKILDIVAKCKKLKAQDPSLSLIVVDYIGLVSSNLKKADNRQLEVQMVSQTLKKLALELKVAIIGVAQLNRKVEERGGEPQLSDLRESGSIEQDADIVLLLHETKVEEQAEDNKNIFDKQNNRVNEAQQEIIKKEANSTGDTKLVTIIVAKNRSGKQGKVPLLFRRNYCKFDSLSNEGTEQVMALENERISYMKRD